MNAALQFASHAAGLRWHDLPPSAQRAAKIFLFDTLAVGAAGARAPHADAIRRVLGSGVGTARVLGRAERLAPGDAALLNAFQIHAQEYDCVHEAAVLHPLSATLGALIGACGETPVDGARFGAALVAGVDIAVSLGLAALGPLSFFRPATAGIFGATAAVARLRGLDATLTAHAFGHALCFVSGTMQAHLEGTPGLPLQVGNAARCAILAVDLAMQGVTGAAGAIDGTFGYLALFEDAFDLGPPLAALGARWRIEELSHKPWPTGRAAHGALDAVRALAAHGSLVASMRYCAPPLIARLVGRPARAGMSVNYARLCLPYLAATLILRGHVGLDSYSPGHLADPEVLALAARIEVVSDGNPDPAAFVPARADAVLRDGQAISEAIAAQPGSPARPLGREARLEKARHCLDFAGVPATAEALEARVTELPDCVDIAAVIAEACR